MEEMKTQQPEPAAESEVQAKKTSLFADILEILETGLFFVILVLFLFTYFMRPVTVEGNSMVPTLQNKDLLFLYSFLYEPRTGDIVVIDNHDSHTLDWQGEVIEDDRSLEERIIKRVIAVEGQELFVDAEHGIVTVDGVQLQENYVNELTRTDDRAFTYPITIPEGYIFVMGDNRNRSTDSRNPLVGLVPVEDVMGKTYFRYFPFDTIGGIR